MAAGDGDGQRRPLTRDQVIAAALRIVDEDGLARLTMRRLGRRLGVDPMAVYHHLPNKGAVLDGVVEAVLDEVAVAGDDRAPWRHRLSTLAHGYRAALCNHPNTIVVVATRPDVTPPALRLLDAAIGIMLQAGFTPAAAVQAVSATSAFVVGMTLAEAGLLSGVAGEWSPDDAAAAVTRAVATGVYPHLTVALSAGDIDMDQAFAAGLDALIAGFDARRPLPGDPDPTERSE